MPQLSFETFVSQYFWLVVILLSFYYLCATQILPKIGEAFKTRRRIESTASSAGEKSLDTTVVKSHQLLTDIFSQARKTGASATELASGDLTKYQKHFVSSNDAWIKQTLSNISA